MPLYYDACLCVGDVRILEFPNGFRINTGKQVSYIPRMRLDFAIIIPFRYTFHFAGTITQGNACAGGSCFYMIQPGNLVLYPGGKPRNSM